MSHIFSENPACLAKSLEIGPRWGNSPPPPYSTLPCLSPSFVHFQVSLTYKKVPCSSYTHFFKVILSYLCLSCMFCFSLLRSPLSTLYAVSTYSPRISKYEFHTRKRVNVTTTGGFICISFGDFHIDKIAPL
jgi:hypothetical protein